MAFLTFLSNVMFLGVCYLATIEVLDERRPTVWS